MSNQKIMTPPNITADIELEEELFFEALERQLSADVIQSLKEEFGEEKI